jgi:hypothetical protein
MVEEVESVWRLARLDRERIGLKLSTEQIRELLLRQLPDPLLRWSLPMRAGSKKKLIKL